MTTLTQIDYSLTSYISSLRDIANEMELKQVFEFDLAEDNLNGIEWTNLSYSGIYFIEIENCRTHTSFTSWASEFSEKWMDDKYRKKFVANPKKSRISRHQELKDWIPIYVGKSKNISKRFYEHIFLDLEKPTFALKLLSRDFLQGKRFRLSTLPLDVQNYDWIMPVLEKSFRDKLNPIIGRQ